MSSKRKATRTRPPSNGAARRFPALTPQRFNFLTAVAFVAMLAAAIRAVYLFELRESALFTVPVGDGWVYVEWARRIVRGEWLPGEPFYQAPLYPYVIAGVFSAFGEDLAALRMLQVLWSAISCVSLAMAGRAFIGPRVGLCAACLLAIYPWSIFSDGLIQKSSLDLLLMTSLLAALGLFVQSSRLSGLVVAGVTLGLFSLNRESARILYPVIVVWLLWHERDVHAIRTRALWAATVSLSFFIVLAPLAIQNHRLSGQVLVSTWNSGTNFYIGNHHAANGTYVPLVPGSGSAEREREDAISLAEAATGRSLSYAEVSAYWLDRGLQFIADEPLSWLTLVGRKIVLSVSAAQLSDTESIAEYARQSYTLRALSWFTPGVILPLAIVGLWFTRHEWRRLSLLYAMCLGVLLSLVLFFVFERYRFPAIPILLLFASVCIDEVVRSLRARGPRDVWPQLRRTVPRSVVITAGAFAALAYVPIGANQADTTLFNVGLALVKAGRSAEAIPVLRRAIERFPDDAGAHYALGLAMDNTGEHGAAIRSFEQATRLSPNDWQAHSALALTLRDAGRIEEAVPHFSRAAQLKPDEPGLHANLGAALAETGRSDDALASFRKAIELRPQDADIRINTASISLQMGRPKESIEHAVAAVHAAPNAFEARYVLGQALALDGLPLEAIQSLQEARRLAQASGRTDVLLRIDAAIEICRAALAKR